MDYYYTDPGSAGLFAGVGIVYLIFVLAIAVVMLVALWKIYAKAGQPGWAAIVPIYNYVILFKIIKMDWWHLLIMLFVPFAALVYSILIPIKLAKVFGKDTGFAVLTLFFPFVCYPILAFGQATYQE